MSQTYFLFNGIFEYHCVTILLDFILLSLWFCIHLECLYLWFTHFFLFISIVFLFVPSFSPFFSFFLFLLITVQEKKKKNVCFAHRVSFSRSSH